MGVETARPPGLEVVSQALVSAIESGTWSSSSAAWWRSTDERDIYRALWYGFVMHMLSACAARAKADPGYPLWFSGSVFPRLMRGNL